MSDLKTPKSTLGQELHRDEHYFARQAPESREQLPEGYSAKIDLPPLETQLKRILRPDALPSD